MANILAAIGGALQGGAQGYFQAKEFNEEEKTRALQQALMTGQLASEGITKGTLPAGASITPDFSAGSTNPFPSASPSVAPGALGTSGIGAPNPTVSPALLAMQQSLGSARAAAQPTDQSSLINMARMARDQGVGGPTAGTPGTPSSGGGTSQPVSPVAMASLYSTSSPDVRDQVDPAAALPVGQHVARMVAQTQTGTRPGLAAMMAAAQGAQSPSAMAPGLPPMAAGAAMAAALRPGSHLPLAGTVTNGPSSLPEHDQQGTATHGAVGSVSDEELAKARGAIAGRINFGNPAVDDITKPGQQTPQYRDLGNGYVQDVTQTPFAQTMAIEKARAAEMAKLWGARNDTNLERTGMQVGGRLEGIDKTQAGADQRSQDRIDASEKTAGANRAAALQRVMTARTPTDSQRAQLELNAYDKLRSQAKDPVTGEYSIDPDTLWQNAQDMVGKALGPTKTSASAALGNRARGATGGSAPAGNAPPTGGAAGRSATGFNQFLGRQVVVGKDTVAIGPKTVAAAQNPNDPNHAQALQLLNSTGAH